MKHMLLWTILLVATIAACDKPTEGYLITANASYDPDTVVVRKNPIWALDSFRMKDNSPWVSLAMQGYEGTEPIYFTIESVISSLGEDAAAIFKNELTTRGGGALMYPLQNNAQPGYYTVSVRLTNAGYSQVVENALTFHVIE